MDITKIFKSKTRQALFRLYFTNPEKSFYLRELERDIGIPVSMLRKELISLEKEELFSSSKQALSLKPWAYRGLFIKRF